MDRYIGLLILLLFNIGLSKCANTEFVGLVPNNQTILFTENYSPYFSLTLTFTTSVPITSLYFQYNTGDAVYGTLDMYFEVNGTSAVAETHLPLYKPTNTSVPLVLSSAIVYYSDSSTWNVPVSSQPVLTGSTISMQFSDYEPPNLIDSKVFSYAGASMYYEYTTLTGQCKVPIYFYASDNLSGVNGFSNCLGSSFRILSGSSTSGSFYCVLFVSVGSYTGLRLNDAVGNSLMFDLGYIFSCSLKNTALIATPQPTDTGHLIDLSERFDLPIFYSTIFVGNYGNFTQPVQSFTISPIFENIPASPYSIQSDKSYFSALLPKTRNSLISVTSDLAYASPVVYADQNYSQPTIFNVGLYNVLTPSIIAQYLQPYAQNSFSPATFVNLVLTFPISGTTCDPVKMVMAVSNGEVLYLDTSPPNNCGSSPTYTVNINIAPQYTSLDVYFFDTYGLAATFTSIATNTWSSVVPNVQIVNNSFFVVTPSNQASTYSRFSTGIQFSFTNPDYLLAIPPQIELRLLPQAAGEDFELYADIPYPYGYYSGNIVGQVMVKFDFLLPEGFPQITMLNYALTVSSGNPMYGMSSVQGPDALFDLTKPIFNKIQMFSVDSNIIQLEFTVSDASGVYECSYAFGPYSITLSRSDSSETSDYTVLEFSKTIYLNGPLFCGYSITLSCSDTFNNIATVTTGDLLASDDIYTIGTIPCVVNTELIPTAFYYRVDPFTGANFANVNFLFYLIGQDEDYQKVGLNLLNTVTNTSVYVDLNLNLNTNITKNPYMGSSLLANPLLRTDYILTSIDYYNSGVLQFTVPKIELDYFFKQNEGISFSSTNIVTHGQDTSIPTISVGDTTVGTVWRVTITEITAGALHSAQVVFFNYLTHESKVVEKFADLNFDYQLPESLQCGYKIGYFVQSICKTNGECQKLSFANQQYSNTKTPVSGISPSIDTNFGLESFSFSPTSVNVLDPNIGARTIQFNITLKPSDFGYSSIPPTLYIEEFFYRERLECPFQLVSNYSYTCSLLVPTNYGRNGVRHSLYGIVNQCGQVIGYQYGDLYNNFFQQNITITVGVVFEGNVDPVLHTSTRITVTGNDFSLVQNIAPDLYSYNSLVKTTFQITNIAYSGDKAILFIDSSKKLPVDQLVTLKWGPNFKQDLTIFYCAQDCNGNGDCIFINNEGSCSCKSPYIGELCAINPQYQCPNNCSGHGSCLQSICSCNNGFTGPDCSSQVFSPSTPVSITVDTTTPSATFSDFNKIIDDRLNSTWYKNASFELSLHSIREIRFDGSLLKEILFSNMVMQPANNSFIYTFNENDQANIGQISINVTQFATDGSYDWMGTTYYVSSGSVKYSITLSDYLFASKLNSLQLTWKMASQYDPVDSSGCTVDLPTSIQVGGSDRDLHYLTIPLQQLGLYARFSNQIELDSREILVSNQIFERVDKSQVIAGVSIPYFLQSVTIDPDFSVLLNAFPSTDNDNDQYIQCQTETSSKKKNLGLVIGLTVGLIGGAALIILLVFLLKGERSRMILHRFKQSRSSLKLKKSRKSDL